MSNTALPQGPWMLPEKPQKTQGVWVHLELLCPRPPDDRRRVVIDGLDFTSRVPGVLVRWLRTGDGGWLGVVNYAVGHVDGRRGVQWFNEQLVPAWALSERP